MFHSLTKVTAGFMVGKSAAKTVFVAFSITLLGSSVCHAQVLLDDQWADGSRAESNRPAEAAVWTGRPVDVAAAPGALTVKLGEASQKLWTYFADAPVTLEVGQKLTASISFIPRGALYATTSRNFRFGVFHDPTNPRVESDTNSDGGGDGDPWADAQGYAVQVLLTNDEYTGTKPLDLGKRLNLTSPSLLGTSGDYAKMSGGTPVHLELDKEYTLTLEVEKVSATQANVTASIRQGENQLSTWTLPDDGATLGSAPVCDKFDQLFLRISNNTTTADQIEFKNFKVEVTKGSK